LHDHPASMLHTSDRVEWIFFDLGWTLVNQAAAYVNRARNTDIRIVMALGRGRVPSAEVTGKGMDSSLTVLGKEVWFDHETGIVRAAGLRRSLVSWPWGRVADPVR